MNKIKWCAKQKNGIKFVKYDEDTFSGFIEQAQDAILARRELTSNKWKLVTAYYACYNYLCAILQKLEIKSAIHECTIAISEYIGFSIPEIKFISNLKEKRINAQYNNKLSQYSEAEFANFILRCEEILVKANFEEIKNKIKVELLS